MVRALQRKLLKLWLRGVTIIWRSAELSALSTEIITDRFVSPRSWVTKQFAVLLERGGRHHARSYGVATASVSARGRSTICDDVGSRPLSAGDAATSAFRY